MHNKELLAIVEAFKKWRHYLEGVAILVEVYTDHKSLTYFLETKTLSQRLAKWLEFLSQFNLSIKFWPGRLRKKPNALTRRWDIYGDNPLKNLPAQRPVFAWTQLIFSITDLDNQPLTLWTAIVTDLQSLISDIKEAQESDQLHTNPLMNGEMTDDSHWTRGEDDMLYYEEQVFIPDTGNLRLQVLKTKHDHVLAGHPGQSKTYQLVRWDFNWPNLQEFVLECIQSCNICGRNKARHHKPYKLLKQLPIPPRPWESILMDFIEQLPLSEGYTDILVVIDQLTKQALFIPTIRLLDAAILAELFIKHVFSKHGVPSHIISNRGTEFVSKFFRSLANALDMKLHFTSWYHPEANGQTECTNQTLEQFLRIYCNYQQSDLLWTSSGTTVIISLGLIMNG